MKAAQTFSGVRLLVAVVLMFWMGGSSGARAQAVPAPAKANQPPAAQTPTGGDARETLAALEAESKPKRQFALFRTAALDPELQELGAALDPVVLSELNTIGGIEVTARPSLDLPAMQLAIDCVGEIAECMAAVAREAGVEALVAPVLRSNGDLVLVTLLYFDTRENHIKGVTRQLAGRSVAQAMLDAVPGMVHEAFGLPPPAPLAEAPAKGEPAAPVAPPPPQEPSRVRRIVPWTLLGVSVASLAVGIGMGVASNHDEDAYAKGGAGTEAEINATDQKKQDAEQKALIANVFFGVAGATAVAGFASWLLLRDPPQRSGNVTLVPQFSRSQVGLSLQGLFGR